MEFTMLRLLALSLFCIIFLNGCSNDFLQLNQTQIYAHKEMLIPADMLLMEVKDANPLNGDRFWIFSFPRESYYNNYINATLPTFALYQSDPQKWQRFEGSTLSGWT